MDAFVARLTIWAQRLANLAQALLLIGVLVTIVDIALRSVSRLTVPGTVDLMQLFVMWSAPLAIPAAFLTDEHVAIDLFTKSMSPRTQRLLRMAAALMGAVVLALLARYGAEQAWREYSSGDSTQTLALPIGLYWLPLLTGLALSALACLALAAQAAAQLISGSAADPSSVGPGD
jgi:TRAP-type C4-dicarboxylate transport system permease small subunit